MPELVPVALHLAVRVLHVEVLLSNSPDFLQTDPSTDSAVVLRIFYAQLEAFYACDHEGSRPSKISPWSDLAGRRFIWRG